MARNHVFTQKIWQAPAVRTLRHLVSAKRIYRYLSARRRRLPDYLVAGAQKSGTTSLWAYLSEHPSVEPAMMKEMSYFDVHYHRGLDWYRMHFPLEECGQSCGDAPGATQTGESTAYYMFHPLAPQRIAQTVPKAKIIFLLRNPVDRAFSHYQLKLRRLQETLTFEAAIDAEAERLAGEQEKIVANHRYYSPAHDRFSYLARGRYVEQIERWQQFFPPEQLLILESGHFFRHPAEAFERVLDFVRLPRWQPAHYGNRFPGKYGDKMRDQTRRRLVDYFAPHNGRLYEHLGTRFDWDR
jgi:Sulfotransferase domain